MRTQLRDRKDTALDIKRVVQHSVYPNESSNAPVATARGSKNGADNQFGLPSSESKWRVAASPPRWRVVPSVTLGTGGINSAVFRGGKF